MVDIDLIERFIASLRRRALSEDTVSAYTGRIGRLASFLEERGVSLATADREAMEAFFDSLVLDNLSPRSRHDYFYCAKSFYRWIKESGRTSSVPMEGLRPPKVTEPLPKTVPDESIVKLLHAVDISTEKGLRDMSILHLLLAGLRVSELVGLDVEDLRQEQMGGDSAGTILLAYIRGKGRRERRVPLSPRTATVLGLYLAKRGDAVPFIFSSLHRNRREPKRMTRRAVRYVVETLAKKADIPKPTLHAFRHTAAIWYVERGFNLQEIKVFMGHKSLATTEKYLLAAKVKLIKFARDARDMHLEGHPLGPVFEGAKALRP